MNEKPKSKRGGARPGAGRKPNPFKDIRTGALTAQRILAQIHHEEQIIELYKLLPPDRKLQAIFKLRDSAYGRPAVSEEQVKPSVPMQINVNIRRVGA